MLYIEVVNFLIILQTNDMINLVQNFIMLMFIAEVDLLMATILKDEVLKDLLSNERF
jgi:hypothetical protein